MQGRTNIGGGGGGVNINGKIEKCIVAPNVNIVAGDFVEPYTATIGSVSLSRTSNYGKIFELSDGRYILFGIDCAQVFEKNPDGSITQEVSPYAYSHSSVTAGVADVQQVGDDAFAIFYGYSSSTTSSYITFYLKYYVIKFDVAKNTFSLDSKNSSTAYIYQSSVTFGTFKKFKIYKRADSTLIGAAMFANVTFIFECTTTADTVQIDSCELWRSRAITDYYYFGEISVGIESTNAYVWKEPQTVKTASITRGSKPICAIDGEIFFVRETSSTPYKTYIRRLSVASDMTLSWHEEEELMGGSGYVFNSLYEDSDVVRFYVNYYTNIFAMDIAKSDYAIVKHPQATRSAKLNSSSLFVIDEGEFLTSEGTTVIEPNKITDIHIIDGTLVDGGYTKLLVKPITTQQYIKGVAKDNGAAGVEIDVYVPNK